MRIISRKQICDFALKHPECSSGLDAWYRIMKHTNYSSFTELRKTFKSVDQVGKLTVFNIGGNKARLTAAIHYNTKRVYVRQVLTHAEYDKDKWKE